MVTAELAVAIPAVVVVLAMCLAAVSVAIDQIRCIEAARIAARAAARGDDVGRVRSLALQAAPGGATVSVSGFSGATHGVGGPVGDSLVQVTVTAHSGGWGGLIPTWTLSATASTPVERSEAMPDGPAWRRPRVMVVGRQEMQGSVA